MAFSDVLVSLINGRASNFQDALGVSKFTDYGIKVPIAYGLSVTIYNPSKSFDWCKSEVETFMCDRMIKMGGAMPLSLDWLDFDIAHGIMYFNKEIGIALIIEPDIGELSRASQSKLDSGESFSNIFNWLANNQDKKLREVYGNSDFKEFYKAEEILANIIQNQFGINMAFVLWPTWEMFFNNWYYTGMMRRGLTYSRH